MKNKISYIAFVQEGKEMVFGFEDGLNARQFAQDHFEGCCEFRIAGPSVIVETQSLQEMGFVWMNQDKVSIPGPQQD